jgi:4-hydroxybenzoate polyprenyltransferase
MKNLFIIAPLLFSKHLLNIHSVLIAGVAFLLFSLLSGSVYLINDIFDLEKDRNHPKKCLRPIPSGRLPLSIARMAAAVLIILSLGASMLLGLSFFALCAGYLILNLAYSLALKHIPFVDVLSIAGGFLLRVAAGAAAISVPPSLWLLVCTFTLAAFLGFGKRTHELAAAGERAIEQRVVLSRYNLTHLKVILWILALCTCVAYVLYTIAPHTRQFFGTNYLFYTSPFAAFGIIRFLRLVSNQATADSPTDEMLKDLPFMLNLAFWAILILLIIYIL